MLRVFPLAPLLLASLYGCSLSTSGTAAVPLVDAGTTGINGAVNGMPVDSGTPLDSGLDAPPEDTGPPGCPLAGMHALKISANVSWDAKVVAGLFNVIEAGNGALDMTVLVDLDRTDNLLEGEFKVCDAQVPTFESTLAGERYGVVFEEKTWDAPTMPRVPVRVELTCPEIGCAATVPKVTVMLGVQMPDPGAPWPDDRALLDYPDTDNDGYGGITLQALGPSGGNGYQYPPTSYDVVFVPTRASQIMLGVRVTAALEGALESCAKLAGEATSLTIETHAPTCTLASNGATCNAEQSAFVDGNLPQWRVDRATFSSVLLDDGADCAAARAAF